MLVVAICICFLFVHCSCSFPIFLKKALSVVDSSINHYGQMKHIFRIVCSLLMCVHAHNPFKSAFIMLLVCTSFPLHPVFFWSLHFFEGDENSSKAWGLCGFCIECSTRSRGIIWHKHAAGWEVYYPTQTYRSPGNIQGFQYCFSHFLNIYLQLQ